MCVKEIFSFPLKVDRISLTLSESKIHKIVGLTLVTDSSTKGIPKGPYPLDESTVARRESADSRRLTQSVVKY